MFIRSVSAAVLLFGACLLGCQGSDKDAKGPPRGNSAKKFAKAETGMLLIGPGPSADVNFGKPFPLTLTIGDADTIARECRPTVKAVAPVVVVRTKVIHKNQAWPAWYLYGTTPAFLDVRARTVERGRSFTEQEVKTKAQVCLLGQTLARELFGKEDPLNKTVRVKDQGLKVVGLLSRQDENFLGYDQDDILLAPWTTIKYRVDGAAQPKVDDSAVVDHVLVRVAGEEAVPRTIEKITALVRHRHQIPPGKPNDFHIRDLGEMARALYDFGH